MATPCSSSLIHTFSAFFALFRCKVFRNYNTLVSWPYLCGNVFSDLKKKLPLCLRVKDYFKGSSFSSSFYLTYTRLKY